MLKYPLNQDAGYKYRPLKTGIKGWDVVGLQKTLIGAGYPLPQYGADGDFGSETSHAVRRFQQAEGLTVDGIAGVLTQRSLVLGLVGKVAAAHSLPEGLEPGQVESESSFWVGNYTGPYADGTRDGGLVMKHVRFSDDTVAQMVFDGPNRIDELATFLRARKNGYYGKVGAKTHERAWQLAVGAWNAPAWADTLSKGGTLSSSQQEHFDSYVARCTTYVAEWSP